MFEEVVHNFGKSDDDMILWKYAYFQKMHTWFHVQRDQKILDGLNHHAIELHVTLLHHNSSPNVSIYN